ncbi:MAG TPA: hypothetical protein VMT12_07660 [Syntrophales bacterium]|nr:hypothetical protein [Syntrophales bacterium]
MISFFTIAPVVDIPTAYCTCHDNFFYGIIAVFCINLYFIIAGDGTRE